VTVLLQISDPHFGTERLPVLEALARLAREQRPDLLVVSGDITQRARRVQFRAARAFLERLCTPWLAIPGNHDIPLFDLRARVLRPYARHCEAFGPDLEPAHDSPELLALGVNTTRWYRHQDGEVSPAQIESVARRLQCAGAAQLRIVVVHQPVVVPKVQDVHNLLRGHAAALRRWAVAGCDLVMGGHIHLPYVTALPGLTRPMWAVQAGTALSWRVRDGVPNSVNLVRWGRDAPAGHCLIERWDCSATGPGFFPVAVDDVMPDRAALGR
jgi:DNA repair exonuclease SbcCD nuclease subunit